MQNRGETDITELLDKTKTDVFIQDEYPFKRAFMYVSLTFIIQFTLYSLSFGLKRTIFFSNVSFFQLKWNKFTFFEYSNGFRPAESTVDEKVVNGM